jgi:signal transduction histidine kinase
MGDSASLSGDMVEAADRVAAGDYTTRRPSVRSAVDADARARFNSMTSKLEVQDRQRRDLMADIAHELRTRLAVLQGRLEGMLDVCTRAMRVSSRRCCRTRERWPGSSTICARSRTPRAVR